MGFKDFPDELYAKTIDSSEKVKLGSLSYANDSRLRYARLQLFLKGASITNEQFRINILSDYGKSNPIYSSEWTDLSDITNLATNWIGWVRFDFDDAFIDSDHTYYLELESQNYTRDADTFYIGVIAEYPITTNDVTPVASNLPIKVELYGVE
jgi:hypothetical protein